MQIESYSAGHSYYFSFEVQNHQQDRNVVHDK